MSEESSLEQLREEIIQKSKEKQQDQFKEKPSSYNAVAHDYTEENERATARVKKANYVNVNDNPSITNKTPQQLKLIELRKKLNNTKKDIYQTVIDEHDRIHNKGKDELEEKKRLFLEKKEMMEREIKADGGDPEREKLKMVLASDINMNAIEKKNKQKKENKNDGAKNIDAHIHTSYKKRVKSMQTFKESDHFKHAAKDDKIIGDLDHGKDSFVPKENINAMKQELLKT
ncbi:putative pre-mRNA-splicing factor [Cavenderia fasciculata]|uniref:Pre-mRNA-splicing factor SYF2 n=1 Tax=Cavenderia fasciculata TaxID=261658 RepID=F4PUF5_CACFS|nr:putative pre-mRNA-splicing factor [Cavenderia fasciculata]EGG21027.1 putative pre-mRNA-splicing factor [Cavenderia fasciculata]|eukprot:XP_004358877.1 putative pre-mRNA-splicing factor [Cavenderia fasciculata]